MHVQPKMRRNYQLNLICDQYYFQKMQRIRLIYSPRPLSLFLNPQALSRQLFPQYMIPNVKAKADQCYGITFNKALSCF